MHDRGCLGCREDGSLVQSVCFLKCRELCNKLCVCSLRVPNGCREGKQGMKLSCMLRAYGTNVFDVM